MKILVCVKRVPDTSARIKVSSDGKGVALEGVKMALAPYDEFAIADALTLKEAHGGEVCVVTVGDAKAEEQLRFCLALGADRAIRVDDPAAQDSDSLGIARVLAAIVEKESPDVVYLGKQATDGDFHAVGAQLATLAGLPFVGATYPVAIDGASARCERSVEGGTEVVETMLPAVFSAEKAKGSDPKQPNLKGIMMAKKKPIETCTLADLGVDAGLVGAGARRVVLEAMSPPPERKAGQILADLPAEEAAERLLTLLRDDAKVI